MFSKARLSQIINVRDNHVQAATRIYRILMLMLNEQTSLRLLGNESVLMWTSVTKLFCFLHVTCNALQGQGQQRCKNAIPLSTEHKWWQNTLFEFCCVHLLLSRASGGTQAWQPREVISSILFLIKLLLLAPALRGTGLAGKCDREVNPEHLVLQ